MTRKLDTATLELAAHDYAGQFLLPSIYSRQNPKVAIGGREWVMQSFYNMGFKDVFEYILPRFKDNLGKTPLIDFEKEAATRFSPRDDKVFADLLADKLAITPDGNHIPGKVGTIQFGTRNVGTRMSRFGRAPANWPVYAGEEEERALGNVREKGKDGPGTDPIPPEDTFWPGEDLHMGGPTTLYALNTNVGIVFAQAALNPALDLLDGGSVAGFINGRTGSQPVDPDASETGTLLFSLTLTTPNPFATATDAAPDALGTAAAIADDTSADASGTLSYCRGSSSNSLFTPLDQFIDGEAGTSGADFNFNTLAIIALATVSMTSWTVTLPQGPSAT